MTTPFSSWRSTYLILLCSLVFLIVLYWPTVLAIVGLWGTSTFSHGFLVLPAVFYLAWIRRGLVASLTPSPTFWVLPLLAGAAFVWLLGNLTATAVIQQFCLVAMIIGLVWGELGTGVARALLFPLAFLPFAVPLGEDLIPALQDFSAWFAVKLLDLSGVPVLLEGRLISVPYGRWEVAEACSGIRYLVSSLAVGFLFAGLMYQTWIRRAGFFLASAVVPILANGLRVYGIVLIGYLGGNRIAKGVDHILAGLLFFAIVMILLFALGVRWREGPQKDFARLSESPIITEDSAPDKLGRVVAHRSWMRIALFGTLGVLVVGLAPLSARLIRHRLDGQKPLPLRPLVVSPPWSQSDQSLYAWRPQFLTPSSELFHTYQAGDHAVKLYVAYYAASQQGAKLASSANQLFDRPSWSRIAGGDAALTLEGHSFRVRETWIRSPQSTLRLWNWYWVDGTFTGNDYAAKLLLAKARLLGSRQGCAAIVLATEDQLPQSQAAAILKDFLSHVSLQESLQGSAENPH